MVADGGQRAGMGHIQQSISLAKELALEAEISFLTKSDQSVLSKFQDNGFPAKRFGTDKEIFRELRNANPHLIIFDKIDVSVRLAEDIKNLLRSRLVIFTNLSAANRYADMAVTADIGSCFENVRFVDPATSTLYFYGPKYWVLRTEFYGFKRKKKKAAVPVKKVLAIFGGSDPTNLSSAVLEHLIHVRNDISIDLILGSHFGFEDEVLKILDGDPKRSRHVNIFRNVSNVAELMFEADLVLASPGLSAFEALCVGTPVIVVPHDNLQRDTYRGFFRMLEREHISHLNEMIVRQDFTFPSDETIRRMEIGDGLYELKGEIMKLAKEQQQ